MTNPDNQHMRFLHFIDSCQKGGAEKHARLIAKQCALHGNKVFFIHTPGPYSPDFQSLRNYGIQCIEMDLRRNFFGCLLRLRYFIKQENINIIHTHQYLASFMATLALTHMNHVKHLITVHTLFSNAKAEFGFLKRLRIYLFTLFAYRKADRIFVLSEAARQMTLQAFNGLANIAIVNNAIDPSEMKVNGAKTNELKLQYAKVPDGVIVLSAGYFDYSKGQHLLIEAFGRHLPDKRFKLILLGDGPQKAFYADLIRKYGLEDRVFLPGYQENISDWYGLADIFVQPSLQDNMPNTILEAMYMGVPTIASDIETIRHIVRHGETGYLFERGNSTALADIIAEVAAHGAQVRQITAQARNYIVGHCTMDKLYSAILSELRVK